MSTLFNPSSVGVIGASSDREKIGGKPIHYLQKHGYKGDIYPVNPNSETIGGLPVYDSISDVPEPPEVVLVIVPARLVLDAVSESLESGVRNILIISSGFAETGSKQGEEAERQLNDWAAEYEATIIGPNSQGIVNFHTGMAASFTPALERDALIPGSVGFITQSGAFGGALATIFQENGVGLSKMIATGNEAATGALALFREFAADEETTVASGYIEGFNDGRELIEFKRTERGIEFPIVVLKVGQSERAKQAAASHTGTLAGEHEIYEGIFKETGVMAVDDIDLFFATINTLLTLSELPAGNLGVLSTSGGAGVHIADAISNNNLTVPTLTADIREKIDEYLPAYGSSLNPVDFAAGTDLEDRTAVLELVFEDDAIDTVILQVTNAAGDRAVEYAEAFSAVKEQYDKPLLLCWTGGFDKERALDIFAEAEIPVFENPVRCVETVRVINEFVQSKSRLRKAKDTDARISQRGSPRAETRESVVTEVEAKALLREYGVTVPQEELVGSAGQAVSVADEIGYPVVAKLVAADIHHRNRVDGVRLNLMDSQSVRSSVEGLLSRGREVSDAVQGVTIQEQVEAGTELAIGISTETDFGPVIMLGRGGTDLESINDTTFRSIPVVRAQASVMIDELDTINQTVLSEATKESVIDAVTGISSMYLDNQWISEADINPLIVRAADVCAVDALFIPE